MAPASPRKNEAMCAEATRTQRQKSWLSARIASLQQILSSVAVWIAV